MSEVYLESQINSVQKLGSQYFAGIDRQVNVIFTSFIIKSSVADPHPDPTFHFDTDPDPYLGFQIKAQNIEKVIK